MSALDRYLAGREGLGEATVRRAVRRELEELGIVDEPPPPVDPNGEQVLSFAEVYPDGRDGTEAARLLDPGSAA